MVQDNTWTDVGQVDDRGRKKAEEGNCDSDGERQGHAGNRNQTKRLNGRSDRSAEPGWKQRPGNMARNFCCRKMLLGAFSSESRVIIMHTLAQRSLGLKQCLYLNTVFFLCFKGALWTNVVHVSFSVVLSTIYSSTGICLLQPYLQSASHSPVHSEKKTNMKWVSVL